MNYSKFPSISLHSRSFSYGKEFGFPVCVAWWTYRCTCKQKYHNQGDSIVSLINAYNILNKYFFIMRFCRKMSVAYVDLYQASPHRPALCYLHPTYKAIIVGYHTCIFRVWLVFVIEGLDTTFSYKFHVG